MYEFPIGKKVFARYIDEYTDTQINFIPMYVLSDGDHKLIGTKNNMIGTSKGYFDLYMLTGKEQINSKNLSNIYQKKKG